MSERISKHPGESSKVRVPGLGFGSTALQTCVVHVAVSRQGGRFA